MLQVLQPFFLIIFNCRKQIMLDRYQGNRKINRDISWIPNQVGNEEVDNLFILDSNVFGYVFLKILLD
jgi:hypothetical protein